MGAGLLNTPLSTQLSECCWNTQGAAEIVLARCVAVLGEGALEQPMSAETRCALEAGITGMAASGLRTICLAQRRFAGVRSDYKPGFFDEPPEDELTLCCIIGIKVLCSHATKLFVVLHACL